MNETIFPVLSHVDTSGNRTPLDLIGTSAEYPWHPALDTSMRDAAAAAIR